MEPDASMMIEDINEIINTVDTIVYYDFGLSSIIYEEVRTYDTENKSPEEIAELLYSRLMVYRQENK